MAATLATIADVTALAPELADAAADDPVAFQATLDLTACMLSATQWGNKLSAGHTTLSAHWATVRYNPGGVGGMVTSRRVDKIQESYSVSAVADSELGTTKYGRMHLALLAALLLDGSKSVTDATTPPDFTLPDERIL